MGIDYSANTIIGYKINTDKFYEEVKKPSCEHNPPANVKFCPTCGVRISTITERHCVDEEEDFTDFLYSSLPKGYIHESPYDGGSFWVGYGTSVEQHTNDQARKMNAKPIEEIKTDIAAFLHTWISQGFIELDESTFGIWTIMGMH